jgi:hypothetical protein
MYQSLKTYSQSELQDCLAGLDSYEALDDSDLTDIFFESNLAELDEMPSATSLVVPDWSIYELYFLVIYKESGFLKAIELFVEHDHIQSIEVEPEPSAFWATFFELSEINFTLAIRVNGSDCILLMSVEYSKEEEDFTALTSKMKEIGFHVGPSYGKSINFNSVIDKVKNCSVSSIIKFASNFITEDSLQKELRGAVDIRLRQQKYVADFRSIAKVQYDSEVAFFQSVLGCIDENYKPSEDSANLEIGYFLGSYSCPFWDVSKSIINTKPLVIPAGKLNDNGPRDHYIISKKVLKDGYKLLVEHSKFPDAELPEQFIEVDFELVED